MATALQLPNPAPAAAAAAAGTASSAHEEQQVLLADRRQQLLQHQQRTEYATHMRQLFSPPSMLHPDGSIDQEFFRPKKVVTLTDKRWGDAEREALYSGILKYGVGKWRNIGQDMLQGWDDHSIRIKAAKLLGCQNLSWYHGRRFSKAEALDELERNRQLGASTGCWKNGMLVDDDRGTLKAHFAAQQQQQQQQQQQLQGGLSAPAAAMAVEAAEVNPCSVGDQEASAAAAAAAATLAQPTGAAG